MGYCAVNRLTDIDYRNSGHGGPFLQRGCQHLWNSLDTRIPVDRSLTTCVCDPIYTFRLVRSHLSGIRQVTIKFTLPLVSFPLARTKTRLKVVVGNGSASASGANQDLGDLGIAAQLEDRFFRTDSVRRNKEAFLQQSVRRFLQLCEAERARNTERDSDNRVYRRTFMINSGLNVLNPAMPIPDSAVPNAALIDVYHVQ